MDGSQDAWRGTVDLNDNDLIVQATPETRDQVLMDITNQIKTARSTSNRRWEGDGLTSSAAKENRFTGLAVVLNHRYGSSKPLLSTFDGESVDNACILVKYTWNGDANVDGRIDAADYFLVDSGFITQDAGYRNGDFDYDGAVDAGDYFLIDSAFIGQSGTLSGALSIVPEPTGMSLLVLSALGLLMPRRRRHNLRDRNMVDSADTTVGYGN